MKIETPVYLKKILEKRAERVRQFRAENSLEDLRRRAFAAREKAVAHRFKTALENKNRTNIIAEFKRVSPSKGAIRADAEPEKIAREYLKGGAAAISVLTEPDFFGGSFEDLQTVVQTTADEIPVLCKDFVSDEAQIFKAAISGASAVLLIIAAFENVEEMENLRRLIEEDLKMDALVEVHTAEEMRIAAATGAQIIGVNNRDLHTFNVTLETSFELAKLAPENALLISESGLRKRAEIKELKNAGFDAFLIGETLMRSDEPEKVLREFVYEN